jgi:hypothetical protein
METNNAQKILDILNNAKANMLLGVYEKFARVAARQAKAGEQIQTVIKDLKETSVRDAKEGEWVVSNVEAFGELQLVDDTLFRKRYDVANPIERKGDMTIYKPKNALFIGIKYVGENVTFFPPNWGGSTQTITTGYMIGGPDPREFEKDFYGIDPDAFIKTYKENK